MSPLPAHVDPDAHTRAVRDLVERLGMSTGAAESAAAVVLAAAGPMPPGFHYPRPAPAAPWSRHPGARPDSDVFVMVAYQFPDGTGQVHVDRQLPDDDRVTDTNPALTASLLLRQLNSDAVRSLLARRFDVPETAVPVTGADAPTAP